MKIAVILLNYNCIEKCINCYKKFLEDKKNEYRFFIIDNNSTENDFSFFKEEGFKFSQDNLNDQDNYFVCLDSNKGYSFGNNVGIRMAKKIGYKYAIVANPDTEIINIDFFEKIVNKYDFLAIFPKVLGPKNEVQSIMEDKNLLQFTFFNLLYPLYVPFYRLKRKILANKSKNNGVCKIQYSIGCFIFFNLDNFEKIDYFDENVFMYGEEQILYQNSKKIQKDILYCDSLVIKHNHFYKEPSEFVKKEQAKSRVYYYKKFKKYPNFIINYLEFINSFRELIYVKLIKKLKGGLK